jgi:hypothetical protein
VHVFVWVNTVLLLVMVIPLTVRDAFPTFVMVKTSVVLLFTTVDRERLLGDKETAGPVATAVPVSGTFCGLFAALSVRVTEAVRVPTTVGLNVKVSVHVAFTASVLEHPFVRTKSEAFVPVRVMLSSVSVADPEFFTVTVCAALVEPSGCEGNVRLVGERLTAGTAGAPVPERGTVWGLSGALSVTEMEAVRAPTTVGVKVTVMAQFAFTIRLLPHVFICVKSPGSAPAIVMAIEFRVCPPVFVRVTTSGVLEVKSTVVGNVKLAGLKLAAA